MDTSHFANLSPELRNSIYEFVLDIKHDGSIPALKLMKHHNQLTRTCRQIRKETQLMFYTLNTFETTITATQLASFCDFLNALGPDILIRIRCLEFKVVDMIPYPGAQLECSHRVQVRGREAGKLKDLEEEKERWRTLYYPIRPKGVETEIFETLACMGLEVKGRGSTWYGGLGPTWYLWRDI